MSRTLLWLSRKSAGYILALAWAIVLIGYGLSAVDSSWPVLALGGAFSGTALFGYPLIVIFGFPARYSSNLTRLVSLLASLSLVALCIASALVAHRNLDPSVPWFLKPLGGVVGLLCFSPRLLILGPASIQDANEPIELLRGCTRLQHQIA